MNKQLKKNRAHRSPIAKVRKIQKHLCVYIGNTVSPSNGRPEKTHRNEKHESNSDSRKKIF